jgi:hypothetical protein
VVYTRERTITHTHAHTQTRTHTHHNLTRTYTHKNSHTYSPTQGGKKCCEHVESTDSLKIDHYCMGKACVKAHLKAKKDGGRELII